MKITGEQLRRFIVSEARAAWAELRSNEKKNISESSSNSRGNLIVENAASKGRFSDTDYSSFNQVLEGCVYLANKGSFSSFNSDLFVSKIDENVYAQLPKRLNEGIDKLEKLQLDSNVKKTAVKYLKSLVLSALSVSARFATDAAL